MSAQHLTETDTGRPAVLPLVPGVVDGFITAVTDTDDSVSLQIRIKIPGVGPEGCDRIEVILDAEYKEALARVLLSSNGPAGIVVHHVALIRCSVGVGARIRPDD
ncbi:hypothetical protein [Streptantibioticus ferralitis]|uniref:Uncharacterized protein n=1 Tax=Streptantibioticus ferralitis TaxID=236510 RepID=A0ABT5YVB3_9ACTN|nr:hypothetical protein [Streptantibioticus ferralitis]MDF2255520.1 hypothetical protein [Streptantibioticus ferralitis]